MHADLFHRRVCLDPHAPFFINVHAETIVYLVMQFLLVIYHRREVFQVKSLTWILDRTLIAAHSLERSKEGVFELPTTRVRDLVERAARRQEETDREQVLAIDLDTETYTYSCATCVKQSIRTRLNPNIRITVTVK